jgi:hypothetical protein
MPFLSPKNTPIKKELLKTKLTYSVAMGQWSHGRELLLFSWICRSSNLFGVKKGHCNPDRSICLFSGGQEEEIWCEV